MRSLWHMVVSAFRRGSRRPLASRRPELKRGPDTTPLGMEATDISAIARVNRHNDSLERVALFGSGRTNIEHKAGHVTAMPEDETYAARYHRAFQQKGS